MWCHVRRCYWMLKNELSEDGEHFDGTITRGCCGGGGGKQPKVEGRGSEFLKFEGPCTSAFQKMLAAACRPGFHYWCRRLDLPCEDSHFATPTGCLYRATGDDTPSHTNRCDKLVDTSARPIATSPSPHSEISTMDDFARLQSSNRC